MSMVLEVATGAGTQEEVPILIRIPRFDGVFAMLGLGDIVRFELIIDMDMYALVVHWDSTFFVQLRCVFFILAHKSVMVEVATGAGTRRCRY